MMKSVDGSLPVLLIDHRPTELEQIGQAGVDISFSGHTHDGQLFPLNLILRNMYPLVWGYKKFSNTHCFVTSGIRLWGPPVRTVGKSEIMVVDVRFK
jgi:predicted MPP superfamily phosphohydrolase